MNKNETTIWQKNLNDLTVGEVIKVNAAAAAISIAIPVAILGTIAVVGKVQDKLTERRYRKFVQENTAE